MEPSLSAASCGENVSAKINNSSDFSFEKNTS